MNDIYLIHQKCVSCYEPETPIRDKPYVQQIFEYTYKDTSAFQQGQKANYNKEVVLTSAIAVAGSMDPGFLKHCCKMNSKENTV